MSAEQKPLTADQEKRLELLKTKVAQELPSYSLNPHKWSAAAWWISGVAVGLVPPAIWYWKQFGYTVAAICLSVPLAIGLGYVSLRQYHRYRSELQGLVDGRRDKQKKLDEEARQAKAAAADTSQMAKALDRLAAKIEGENADLTKRLDEIRRTHDTTSQTITAALAAINDRLAEIKPPRESRGLVIRDEDVPRGEEG